MSAAKKRTVPELRFPGFAGEWKEKHGRDLFVSSRTKGEEGLPIYSVTLNNGLVPRDSLERHMADDAAPNVSLRAKPDDLVYNMMRMWQGAVGRAEVDCMVSPAYVVLSPRKTTDSKFFDYALQRARSLYDLWAYSYGLTDDRLRLYPKDFGQIPFSVPNYAEQQKITVFLGVVDAKLTALRRKRELLQEYKRGMMQKIFSRELRFKRDDGSEFPDWEEKRLGEVASFAKGKGISKEDIAPDGKTPCIRYGELYTRYNERIDNVISFTNKNTSELLMSEANDVVIPASGETAIDIATAACVTKVGVALGGDINAIRGEFNGVFLAHYLNNWKRKDIARLAQGISVIHLYGGHLKSLNLSLPSLDEQQKIADFLSAIDAKIEAVAKQIEKVALFKKGLLQKMFV